MNVTKTINKLPKSQVDVNITVPWTDVAPVWSQTTQKLAQEVEIPGFRKGQAPLEMVEPRIAVQLQQEVMQTVMPQALMDALQGTPIVPIDYPNYQLISFSKGGNLQFKALITERPSIQVGNYKAIKVTKPQPKPVTDEDVNKIVTELFNRWKARNPAVAVPQGQPQPTSNQAGTLSFNQPLQAATTPVSAAQVTEPNDEFAKAVGADNLVDLRTRIKQDLENEANYNNELDYEEFILQEVEKITTVELPEILIQDELNRMLVSLQRSVTERGLLLDEYLKSQNKTVDSIKQEWRPQAEKNVRMELGLSEVARMEGVTISDDELQGEINKIQDARVKAQFEAEEPKMHLRHALRQTKTLNLLKTLVG